MLRIVFCFLVLVLTPPRILAAECDGSEEDTIRIAILYRSQSSAGEALLQTVTAVLDRQAQDVEAPQALCWIKADYPNEQRGFERLSTIRDQNEADVVIGPTDSGVFRDALRDGKQFETARLPVISPVVAAHFDIPDESWLFQTNTDAKLRAQSIRNFLKQRGVDSVGVIYEGSEFGVSAEESLSSVEESSREAARQFSTYQAARYRNLKDQPQAVESILAARPAAIGIFASVRSHLDQVCKEINRQKFSLNPYNPYLFTIIDTRPLRIPGLDFVTSGTVEEDETSLNSKAVAADILGIIRKLKAKPGTLDWRRDFRDTFAGLLQMNPPGTNGHSRMILSFEGTNQTPSAVAVPSGLFDRLLRRPEVVFRRYGFLPILNIAIVISLVVFLTRQDLRKWNDERRVSRETRKKMTQVALLNMMVALFVFFSMIWMGLLEWNSVAGALAVGVGYPALLKSTVGQTAGGRSLGVSELYDDILRNLNDEIMVLKYHQRKPVIDYIAMTNAPSRMRETLMRLYSFNSPKRKAELIQGLETELDAAKNSLDRRMIYAKRIERTHTWEALGENKFVPSFANRDSLIGPEEILQVAVDYCDQSPTITLESLNRDFEKRIARIEKLHPERAKADRAEVKEWLDGAQTNIGDMRAYLRWLFIQERFQVRRIIEMGYLLPESQGWERDEWKAYESLAVDQQELESHVPQETDESEEAAPTSTNRETQAAISPG